LLLLFFAAGCAVDRPPSGGPVDTEPLVITAVDPAPMSTGITPSEISFSFNRYVTATELRRSLSISPAIAHHEIKSSGKEARLLIPGPLEQDRTYSVTINASLQSTRGNRLNESYSYAFSTGQELDTGLIAGIIYTSSLQPAPEVTVQAYLLDDSAAGPPVGKPDYTVLSGSDGTFRFRNMQEGSYRLLVFRDTNQNGTPDLPGEQYAAGTRAVLPTGTENVLFRLGNHPGENEKTILPSSKDNGAIIGTIQSDVPLVVIEAVHTGNGSSNRVLVSSVSRQTPFLISGLAAGDYVVSAYEPAMQSGTNETPPPWNPGTLIPFSPADQFTVHPAMIKVRAGWTTGNILLEL